MINGADRADGRYNVRDQINFALGFGKTSGFSFFNAGFKFFAK
jgi:hypothetical protein